MSVVEQPAEELVARPASGAVEGAVLDLEEQTDVGGIYLSALIRRQLRLSVLTVGILVAVLCAQPLLSWLWPAFGDLRIFSIPVTWLLLGVGSYPLMFGLALHYTRRAEAIDDEFTDLLR